MVYVPGHGGGEYREGVQFVQHMKKERKPVSCVHLVE